MKDSGVGWIRGIPSGWSTKKLKHVSRNRTKKVEKSNNHIDLENIESNTGKMIESETRSENQDQDQEQSQCIQFQENDVLFGKLRPYLRKFYLSSGIGSCSSELLVIEPANICPQFLYFLVQTDAFIQYSIATSYGVKMPRTSWRNLREFEIPFPTKEEQHHIGTILEIINAQIMGINEKKAKQIELLHEYEKSVIHNAVTKGLDSKAKMRDSGIQWIGEVPEKWRMIKLRNYSYIKGRIGWQGLRADEFVDSGPYLITGMHFDNGSVDWNSCYHITNERYDEAPEIQVQENDVLITKDGTIGKLAYIDILPGPASLNSHVLLIRPVDNAYLPKFLFWLLQSNSFLMYTNLRMTGTTFYGITQKEIENFRFGCPSIDEQEEISSYLDSETTKIHQTVSKLGSEITKFEEYRKSLIREVVTGKVNAS